MMVRSIVPSPPSLPSVFTARPEARTRMRDFFSSHIRNPNTRRAYREAVRQFSAFCTEHDIVDLAQVEPVHVAAFVETQLKTHSRPTVKLRLAALRMLFDWRVVGQVIPTNPAHAVRGPKHTQRKGKTPVLNVDEARTLLDAIDATSLPGLRDRALIGLMVYTFARMGATISMKVEDFFVQGRRGGCGSMRRAARSTRCRLTTISTATWRSTSRPPASPRTGKARSSAPYAEGQAS
jgi:integrase/recombinase XerD